MGICDSSNDPTSKQFNSNNNNPYYANQGDEKYFNQVLMKNERVCNIINSFLEDINLDIILLSHLIDSNISNKKQFYQKTFSENISIDDINITYSCDLLNVDGLFINADSVKQRVCCIHISTSGKNILIHSFGNHIELISAKDGESHIYTIYLNDNKKVRIEEKLNRVEIFNIEKEKVLTK